MWDKLTARGTSLDHDATSHALSPGLPSTRRVTETNSVLKTFYRRIKKRLHLVILENSLCKRSFFFCFLYSMDFCLSRSSPSTFILFMLCR